VPAASASRRCCQRESTISIDTVMPSTNAGAASCDSAAASAGVTSRPRRSATSASIRRRLKCVLRPSAGLGQTCCGGSGACVSKAGREAPPDFQYRGSASPNQAHSRATRSCAA
jgi:hypothetical protein